MRAAQAILPARGGMTSHAALVARGWGKCCIVGCGAIHIDYAKKELAIDGKILKEGDWITLNGTKGNAYEGRLPMIDASEENVLLNQFLKIKKFRRMINSGRRRTCKKSWTNMFLKSKPRATKKNTN